MNRQWLLVVAACLCLLAPVFAQTPTFWQNVGNSSTITSVSVDDPFITIEPTTNRPLIHYDASNSTPGLALTWNGTQWVQQGGGTSYGQNFYNVMAHYLVNGVLAPISFFRDYSGWSSVGGDGIVSYFNPATSVWIKSPTAASTGSPIENGAHDVSIAVNTNNPNSPMYNQIVVAYIDRTTNPTAPSSQPPCSSSVTTNCFDEKKDDLTVMKYDPVAGTFSLLGGHRGLTGAGVYHTSVEVADDGTIYVGYRTASNGSLNVIKYDPATDTFSAYGNPNFATGSNPMMKLNHAGVPYIVYVTGANLWVRKYDSSSNTWILVGPVVDSSAAIGASGWRHRAQIAFDSQDNILVAALKYFAPQKVFVKKYDAVANTWQSIGANGFTAGSSPGLTMALDAHDTPYISYIDATQGNKLAVKAYAPSLTVSSNPSIMGNTVTFNLDDPLHPNQPFIFLGALGTSPGIPLDDRTIPLNDDFVFNGMLSSPTDFGFNTIGGVLDATGHGQIVWNIPSVPAVSGIHVFFSFLTYSSAGITSPSSITSISPPIDVTLQ